MTSTSSGGAGTGPARIVVYGDFNCPYSYLASQRLDEILERSLADVEWRAVEHDRSISLTGEPTGPTRDEWQRELDEVAGLAIHGEDVATAPPAMLSNTRAATSAFAEAMTDGLEHEMRRALFEAVWVRQQNISTAGEVRQVVTRLMWPPVPLQVFRATDLPMPSSQTEPARVARVLGGTVAPDGGPLSTPAYRRIQRWRQEWLSLPQQVVPTVVDEGELHQGVDGLKRLAEICAVQPGRR
ncbi:MAG: DsbA family protein [Actinomycetes bacterium]